MSIFISHAPKDTLLALCFSEALRRIDLSSSIAEDYKHFDLFQGISQGVMNCSLFVILLSPEFAKCRQCQDELAFARVLKKKLFAITVKPCLPKDLGVDFASCLKTEKSKFRFIELLTDLKMQFEKAVILGKENASVITERMKLRDCEQNDANEMRTELKTIGQELKILCQDVISLTRTMGRTSDRPVTETGGDDLDLKLLVGLNQSFQQLMAENRRLSDHFTQLLDFAVQQMMRTQCPCEVTSENFFKIGARNSKPETVDEVQLHCGSSLPYDSGIPGFSHFQGANSSCLSGVSGGVAEDEDSKEEEEQEEKSVDRGDISCCTDPDYLEGKEEKVLGNRSVGEEEEEERDEEGGSGSSHSTGKSDDGSSTDPDRLEEDRCIERGMESESGAERKAPVDDGKCSLSSTDDIHYTPDFKSETSSSCPEADTEAETDGLAAEVAEPADNITPTQNLDATAEEMGFVVMEFVHAPSGGRSNSENEKGSSVSDESWEKMELPEKDPEFHPTESDTSEEIVKEIIVEDCGSSDLEELTLDQLREKLAAVSKEIERRMTLECRGELSAQRILETVDTEPQNELGGDPRAIKQPASPFDKE